ncbi:hypothetical protein [Paraburkholderia caribensis]|uniref:hypothetical protein n=1 Tax=Paraburkholderia caribensis TaxID=75105 RepID=UPI001CB3DEE0|nr:hypothetical protein [Paraburkholderia caribensis]CAG9255862.1 conserved hypothetical protein [Paraburkholderia caribensis]
MESTTKANAEEKPLVDLRFDHPPATLNKRTLGMLTLAKAYKVDNAETRELAVQDLMKIKTHQKSVEDQRTAITQPMNAALRAVNALFKVPTDYLDQAEALLKAVISKYDREQEQLRIAEQAKAEEAARQERARLAAEAAAAAASANAEAEKLEQQAAEASKAGNVEEAARLSVEAEQRVEQGAAEVEMLQQTATLVTAPVVTAAPRSRGVSSRKVWKAEVENKLELIKYVAEHPEYVDLLDTNMPAINKIALALKANCPLKGVRVFEDSVIAARAA